MLQSAKQCLDSVTKLAVLIEELDCAFGLSSGNRSLFETLQSLFAFIRALVLESLNGCSYLAHFWVILSKLRTLSCRVFSSEESDGVP